MLRRKPTRLELKLDDTEEFESVKKELEGVFPPHTECSQDRLQILTRIKWLLNGGAHGSLSLDDLHRVTDLSQMKGGKSRKKQRDEVDVVGVATSEMSGSVGGSEGKTREQTIHERIGYKPHPKSNTLPSFFGNLQF